MELKVNWWSTDFFSENEEDRKILDSLYFSISDTDQLIEYEE